MPNAAKADVDLARGFQAGCGSIQSLGCRSQQGWNAPRIPQPQLRVQAVRRYEWLWHAAGTHRSQIGLAGNGLLLDHASRPGSREVDGCSCQPNPPVASQGPQARSANITAARQIRRTL